MYGDAGRGGRLAGSEVKFVWALRPALQQRDVDFLWRAEHLRRGLWPSRRGRGRSLPRCRGRRPSRRLLLQQTLRQQTFDAAEVSHCRPSVAHLFTVILVEPVVVVHLGRVVSIRVLE